LHFGKRGLKILGQRIKGAMLVVPTSDRSRLKLQVTYVLVWIRVKIVRGDIDITTVNTTSIIFTSFVQRWLQTHAHQRELALAVKYRGSSPLNGRFTFAPVMPARSAGPPSGRSASRRPAI